MAGTSRSRGPGLLRRLAVPARRRPVPRRGGRATDAYHRCLDESPARRLRGRAARLGSAPPATIGFKRLACSKMSVVTGSRGQRSSSWRRRGGAPSRQRRMPAERRGGDVPRAGRRPSTAQRPAYAETRTVAHTAIPEGVSTFLQSTPSSTNSTRRQVPPSRGSCAPFCHSGWRWRGIA